MAVTAGSVWVQGDYLHFAASTTTNYRYLGTFVAYRSTGIAGSIWIDAANLRYLDSTKNERYLPLGAASAPAGVASAINGSVWVENNRLNSVEGSTKQKREYHVDVAHQDSHYDVDHDDVAFSNIALTSIHTDNHSDGHYDVSFENTHGDIIATIYFANSHTDVPFSDDPNESYVGFENSHTNQPFEQSYINQGIYIQQQYYHNDIYDFFHTDIPHSDQPHFDVSHGDNPFTNVSFVSQPEFVGNI